MSMEDLPICSFVLEGMPLIYFGELVTDKGKIVFKKPLVKRIDDKETVTWYRIPTTSASSTLQIDTRSIRGFFVKDIDQTDLEEYKEAWAKIFQKKTKLYTV